MKIVCVSYYYMKEEKDPQQWLARIGFFHCILEELASRAEVINLGFIKWTGEIQSGNVRDIFWKPSFFSATRYIEQLKPEIIIVQGFHSSLQILYLKQVLGSKAKIIIQHRAEKPAGIIKRYFQRAADQYVHAYFFASAGQGLDWVNAGIIQSKRKLHSIMGASSVFHVVPKNEARKRLQLPLQQKIFLWVGRLNSNKDPLTLIRAFINYLVETKTNAGLYLVYHTEELIEAVRYLIQQNNVADRIALCGRVPHAELLFWYNSCDFIVNTSHYEGGNISVVEAMSCGCIPVVPAITSFKKHTGNFEIGYSFVPGDVASLTEAFLHTGKMNIELEKNKVLEYYSKHLSASAIAQSMLEAVS